MTIFCKTFVALAAGLALACMAFASAHAQTLAVPALEKIKLSGKAVLGVHQLAF